VELKHDHQDGADGNDDGDQHHHQHDAQGGERRPQLRRIEVITGVERRRRWSAEEKAKITAESQEPGVKVAAVARRHGVSLGLLHSWRRATREHLAVEPLRFVPVVAKTGIEEAAGDGTIEIAIGDTCVRVSGPVDIRALRTVLAAVRTSG
jgi:transposase